MSDTQAGFESLCERKFTTWVSGLTHTSWGQKGRFTKTLQIELELCWIFFLFFKIKYCYFLSVKQEPLQTCMREEASRQQSRDFRKEKKLIRTIFFFFRKHWLRLEFLKFSVNRSHIKMGRYAVGPDSRRIIQSLGTPNNCVFVFRMCCLFQLYVNNRKPTLLILTGACGGVGFLWICIFRKLKVV